MKKLLNILIVTGLIIYALTACNDQPNADTGNPFFTKYNTPFDVPPFEKIMAKHYMPAFEKGMADGRKEIEDILAIKKNPTFKNTIEAFDKGGDLLTRVMLVFFAQTQANTNDSLQNIEVEISPKFSAFNDEIRLNPELFKRVKSVYENQA